DMKYAMFPMLERIPGFRRSHLTKHIDFINSVILSIIDKRKKKQANNDSVLTKNLTELESTDLENKDLLHYLLKAETDETNLKKALTTEELLNDLKVFLIAGHDSTASALSATLYYLGKNPDCQQKAREEVIKIMGDEKRDIIPTLNQIKEMKYINMVINETLRIHPPAPGLNARVTQKETSLGEYVLPKGQVVIPNLYALHHSKKLWGDEPYRFQPERFADSEGNTLQSYKFTPFGGGVRICIGMNFSLAEQRVFLAMLVRKYRWTIPKETIHKDKIEFRRIYTLPLKEGID
ncbi:18854_t:CDS:2, partial [Acaulospora morrowiae]